MHRMAATQADRKADVVRQKATLRSRCWLRPVASRRRTEAMKSSDALRRHLVLASSSAAVVSRTDHAARGGFKTRAIRVWSVSRWSATRWSMGDGQLRGTPTNGRLEHHDVWDSDDWSNRYWRLMKESDARSQPMTN